jgi:GNAT superfamily N-acetyltransferase
MTSRGWPAGLAATAVRFARATWRLDELHRFYGAVVGLPVLFEFDDHDGYDGVVFALPDPSAQLELVTPPTAPSAQPPGPEDALIVYLTGVAAADAVRGRLRRAGAPGFVPENPYWLRRGAFGVLDPDGWPVLFVPTPDEDPDADPDGAVPARTAAADRVVAANEVAQVRAHERAFFDALVAADATALDGVLAEDFLIVDVLAGQVASRADLVGAVSSGSLRFTRIDHDDATVQVRFRGPVAVSVGSTAMTVQLGDLVSQVRSRFTHVHVRTADGWRLLSAQGTPLRDAPPPANEPGVVEIVRFDRPRRELVDLFRLAEDSDTVLARYIDLGTVWVAREPDGTVVGHVQSVPRDGGRTSEVLNTAVVENRRGQGIGRRLLRHAVEQARRQGATRVQLATAAADVGNLRFYQRCGLRLSRVVPDAFVPSTGYPEPILIDGIPLRDQVWFTLDLPGDTRPGS